jgi:hypothetical protein
MRHSLLIATACLLTAGLSAQQQLIQNGDFSNNLTGWTGSGPGTVNGIVTHDVTGDGNANNAFQIHPGGNVYAPPHAPYILETNIAAGVPNVDYLFSCDVHVEATGTNAQGGMIEFYVEDQNSNWVKVYEFNKYIGSTSGGTNNRHHLSGVVRFLKAGPQKVQFHIWRPKYTQNTGTPRWTVDNISLLFPGRAPYVHCQEVRKTGGSFGINIEGEAGAAGALFLGLAAPQPLPTPFGSWILDLATTQFLASGALSAANAPSPYGTLAVNVPIPADPSLQGLALSFQAVTVGKGGLSTGMGLANLIIN